VEDERYRINTGRHWRIGRGTEFTVTTPTFAEGGKVSGYRETGRMEVKRGDDSSSLAEVATLKKGEKVQLGDRVVRWTGREGEGGDQRTYFLLTAKGGVGTDVNPLAGTNVYLNGEWKGATRSEERRVGKECRSRWWRGRERENGKGYELERTRKVDNE